MKRYPLFQFWMKDGSCREVNAEEMEVSSRGLLGRKAYILKIEGQKVAEVDHRRVTSYKKLL